MILTLTVQQIKKIKQIVQQMVDSGVHFGHRKRQRNPKMIPYIYKKKERIGAQRTKEVVEIVQQDDFQIIDLLQTYWYLKKASLFLFNLCRRGKRVLFVGTKKHVAKCIEQTAKSCNSWYINKRWLGGLLTNWKTMAKSVRKMQQENQFISKSKKEKARIERQRKRLLKYFGGIKTMPESELPDVVIIVGQQKEMNAVHECKKLEIPSLTILDTNCDPSLTDFVIPANDDSVTSVNYILTRLSKAIQEGQKDYQKQKKKNKYKKIEKYNHS